MRTNVTIDDALYEKALEMADPDMEKANIFQEAMKAFVLVGDWEAACEAIKAPAFASRRHVMLPQLVGV